MEGKSLIAVVVACFKVDLQCKHLLGQTQKNYKNTQSKFTGHRTLISKTERAGDEAGEPAATKSYGNTIRVWKMSRLINPTFNVSVVHPSVLLQDSNGGTRQRQYMEQGETGIQTSCLDLQRTKATFLRPLPMTIQYRFRNHTLRATPPDL